jgi:hypothetical protein
MTGGLRLPARHVLSTAARRWEPRSDPHIRLAGSGFGCKADPILAISHIRQSQMRVI